MRLAQILFTQGFGSRRECDALLRAGQVQVAGETETDGGRDLPEQGLALRVQGLDWVCHTPALVLLHKPAGYECSRAPRHHPSVLSLLPAPLRRRGVQPVGRLDEDTTGLLLLTDDGALIHRLTSPRHHVHKVYEVTTRHPVDEPQLAHLQAGVVLHDAPGPVRALKAERLAERRLRMTLDEGKYHQVKRMVAAVGNRVEALHRSRFGALTLPAALACGQWCWLDSADAVLGLASAGHDGRPG